MRPQIMLAAALLVSLSAAGCASETSAEDTASAEVRAGAPEQLVSGQDDPRSIAAELTKAFEENC